MLIIVTSMPCKSVQDWNEIPGFATNSCFNAYFWWICQILSTNVIIVNIFLCGNPTNSINSEISNESSTTNTCSLFVKNFNVSILFLILSYEVNWFCCSAIAHKYLYLCLMLNVRCLLTRLVHSSYVIQIIQHMHWPPSRRVANIMKK